MAVDIRKVKDLHGLVEYFAVKLGWNIDFDDFEDIEDITYDFDASDIGLKEEAFAKISALRQLPPLVDGQRWGIFSVEFDSKRFEVTALRKILSGLIPKRRNAADHAVWNQQDLLFLCFWGEGNERTIGVAHFADKEVGLPQIRMIYCAPAVEDFTQIRRFEERLSQLKWPDDPSNAERWSEDWSGAFRSAYRQTITDSSTLTRQLAIEAQDIRNRIMNALDVEAPNGYVHTLYDRFKEKLIHNMTEQQFADMYAQTVVYGLFSARCMDTTQEDFSATEAINCIPNTNPFLKHLMQECLGAKANSRLSFDELEIANVVELLQRTQTETIIQDFNRQTGGGREDPVIHFYEEFLTAYDKAQKVQRGVFYTPQPVVNFIVRAVDDLLRTEFGIADGLASTETKKIRIQRESKKKVDGLFRTVNDTIDVPAVQVLDPSTGTGTFLRQIILQIYNNYLDMAKQGQVNAADWSKYVDEHLLPRINGFELMMAPYAVAHMKLAMVLKDTGYDFSGQNRLNVYLTNTLEKPGTSGDQIAFGEDPLSAESVDANGAKKNNGVNIVLGNPPYSGESANKEPFALALIDDYKYEPGGVVKLQEKNPKWLNDDYVKFIRYAQELVSRSGRGIVAFINPHGFIGNPTFRGMRWSLMQTFDAIYIIDLHGNSNRKETSPDGSKDENVFDIQQGVCICIFVKKHSNGGGKCHVYHADLYGTRENKYRKLAGAELNDMGFAEVSPEVPDLLFHPVNYDLRGEYDKGFSVDDLFTLGSVGIVTARDKLTLALSESELIDRANDFRTLSADAAREKYSLGKDVRDWRIAWAQADLNNHAVKNGTINTDCIIPIMYRVFDQRKMIYTGTSRGFVCYPRSDITRHFILGDNMGLATARSNKSNSCDHFYVTDMMMEAKCSERTTQGIIYPLFSYHLSAGKLERTVNYNTAIISEFSKRLGLRYSGDTENHLQDAFSAKEMFYYIYTVLYSPKYRKRFFEFLKSDYPKIPYATDVVNFWKMVDLGHSLCKLHLLHDIIQLNTDVAFQEDGSRLIEKVSYRQKRVYINKKSYFDKIEPYQWDFTLGGYQPLQRWFKDRKMHELTDNDIDFYCGMAETIAQTVKLMNEIDTNVLW